MNKKQRIILIVGIIFAVLLVVGGSYAFWRWTSNVNKNVAFNTANLEKYIVYDEGDAKFIGNFQPTSTFCESAHNSMSFYKESQLQDKNVFASIKMQVNSIGSNIAASNDVYWIVTSGDSNITCADGLSSSSVLASGNFNGVVDNQILELYNDIEVTTTEQVYTVWIWIDSNGSNLSNLSGETIDTNIWTDFEMFDSESSSGGTSNGYQETLLNGADPVLESGMVPITLSADGVVTSADTSSEWYNYQNKEWANAVLVDSTVRGTYINNDGTINDGLTISEANILAYYVWIPRYKYAFPNANGNPETISIIFENKDTPKSTGTATGTSYYTHPAFTFGENNELNGIWVGKFESSGDATTPTIKPNVESLRNQTVSAQFTTSLKFAGGTMNTSTGEVTFAGNNTYGLTPNTDSHMMKNSEWGAVAYLSHSQYGINEEIYINNSKSYYTGRSGGNVGGSVNSLAIQFGSGSTSTRYNSYGYYTWTGQSIDSSGTIGEFASDRALGTKASTTGNVTGVYDMSGGAWDYVMGNYGDITDSSGFTTLPSSKYYDLYSSSQFTGDDESNMTLCTLATCGGHALLETKSWYSDYAKFVVISPAWFLRGGHYNNGAKVGVFNSSSMAGFGNNMFSWRSVLVAENGV